MTNLFKFFLRSISRGWVVTVMVKVIFTILSEPGKAMYIQISLINRKKIKKSNRHNMSTKSGQSRKTWGEDRKIQYHTKNWISYCSIFTKFIQLSFSFLPLFSVTVCGFPYVQQCWGKVKWKGWPKKSTGAHLYKLCRSLKNSAKINKNLGNKNAKPQQ